MFKYISNAIMKGISPNYTQYRYCDRTETTTYYWQKPIWSNWSSWSTTPIDANDTTEVETRETYRY